MAPDFWAGQITAAANAWALLFLFGVALLVGFKIKLEKVQIQIRELKKYADAAECRLKLAGELTSQHANEIAKVHEQVADLEQRIGSDAEVTVMAPLIKEIAGSVDTLAIANSTADHIVTAQHLAIGGLEREQKLALITPPSQATSPHSEEA